MAVDGAGVLCSPQRSGPSVFLTPIHDVMNLRNRNGLNLESCDTTRKFTWLANLSDQVKNDFL